MENSAFLFKNNLQVGVMSPQRKQALLIGLMGGEQVQFYTNSLTTGINPEELSQHLSPLSKANNKPNLQLAFDFLKEEGERSGYDIMISPFLSSQEKEIREDLLNTSSIDRLVKYGNNLKDFITYIKGNDNINITREDLQRGILAWDLGRLILFSRMACDCGILNEEEAWDYIEFAERKCREIFKSWEEIGKSFLLGQTMNHPGEEGFQQAIDYFLLTTRNIESPWVKCTFK